MNTLIPCKAADYQLMAACILPESSLVEVNIALDEGANIHACLLDSDNFVLPPTLSYAVSNQFRTALAHFNQTVQAPRPLFNCFHLACVFSRRDILQIFRTRLTPSLYQQLFRTPAIRENPPSSYQIMPLTLLANSTRNSNSTTSLACEFGFTPSSNSSSASSNTSSSSSSRSSTSNSSSSSSSSMVRMEEPRENYNRGAIFREVSAHTPLIDPIVDLVLSYICKYVVSNTDYQLMAACTIPTSTLADVDAALGAKAHIETCLQPSDSIILDRHASNALVSTSQQALKIFDEAFSNFMGSEDIIERPLVNSFHLACRFSRGDILNRFQETLQPRLFLMLASIPVVVHTRTGEWRSYSSLNILTYYGPGLVARVEVAARSSMRELYTQGIGTLQIASSAYDTVWDYSQENVNLILDCIRTNDSYTLNLLLTHFLAHDDFYIKRTIENICRTTSLPTSVGVSVSNYACLSVNANIAFYLNDKINLRGFSSISAEVLEVLRRFGKRLE